MAGIPMQDDSFTPSVPDAAATPQGAEMGSGLHPDPQAALEHEQLDVHSDDAEARLQDLNQGPFLSSMGSFLPELRRKLEELQRQEQEIEAKEQQRGQTPLAVTLQVVSCRWGREHYPGDKMLPVIEVEQARCPKRLTTTNQDCRDCAYVKLIAYGTQHEEAHTRRYLDHGMIIPVTDENEANKLASVLGAISMTPLRRIAHEIEAVKKRIAEIEFNENQVRVEHLNLRRAQGAQ